MSRFYLATSVLVLVILLQWRHGQCITNITYLYGPNGDITTPGYPNGYPRRSSFYWYITVEKKQAILLDIQDFDLLMCSSSNCGACDVMDISDGYTSRRFCKSTSTSLPKSIFSRGNTMNISFHSGIRNTSGNGSRGLWLSYHTLFFDGPTIIFDNWPTGDPGDKGSSKRTFIPGSALFASIVAVVILIGLVLSCYGIKKRLSRPSSPRQQNCPEDHPSSFTAPSDLQISDEEFQASVAPPPSYEEAARSSQSNISIPSLSFEPNQREGSTQVEAYDSTGLPSYNEALKIGL